MSLDMYRDQLSSKDPFRLISLGRDRLSQLLSIIEEVKNSGFSCLIDITCVDYPDRENRFELIYMFLDLHDRRRLTAKFALAQGDMAGSIIEIYPSSDWLEREVFDMYGIKFIGHREDLPRILSDYGFEGHPLLKDFPLSGYTQVRYDIEKQQVVNEPVQLMQEYRDFDFLTPWEGNNYIDSSKKQDD